MISPKTYFHTADRSKVVEEGDKDAKFLIVREGHEIAAALWEKYGMGNEAAAPEPEHKKKSKH